MVSSNPYPSNSQPQLCWHSVYKLVYSIITHFFQLGSPKLFILAKCQNTERSFFRQFITFFKVRTYILLVFYSITFKLYDFGQLFWVSFHKLLTIVCWNFGPFLMTELVQLSQVCRLPFSQPYSCLFSSAHKFSIWMRSGLCDGHSKALTLLSLSQFVTNLAALLPASASIFTSLLLLFWGWYANYARKHIHLWETEPNSFLSDMMAGHFHGLYLRIIVLADELGTFRHLEIVSKDEPDLWKSTILFLTSLLVSFDFPMMSHKEAVCLRCALKYIHRCACN